MKNLSEYINEAMSVDGSRVIDKYLPVRNALEFTEKLKKDKWELDVNYSNWSGGEFVVLLYRRGNENLWVEWDDRKGDFKGECLEEYLPKLKTINNSEYKK